MRLLQTAEGKMDIPPVLHDIPAEPLIGVPGDRRHRQGNGAKRRDLQCQPVSFRRGAAEQSSLFVRRIPCRNALEGVPQDLIAAGALVDREIAFEHRARESRRGQAR